MTQQQFSIVEPSFTSEDRTRSYYRWRAAGYDQATKYEIKHHREAIDLAAIQPGDHVLEVACGTGRATAELATRLGDGGSLDAIDLSPDMLQHAQHKVTRMGLLHRVSFLRGSAQALPCPSAVFDVLYNSYMFDLVAVSQFGGILNEFMRVLKPAGRLVLVNMSKHQQGVTPYEWIYKLLRSFPCRPVAMLHFVQMAGFTDARRIYRSSFTGFFRLPFGTEIVTARRALQ